MRKKITALIPCFNEETMIEDCLKSVEWADEILLVDSFSTDKTLEIAKAFNPRILQHEYENSAAQKNWAIPQASHEWVLIVDSDERVTPQLRDEILKVLEMDQPEHAAYRIYRQNHFFGFQINHCGWDKDDVTRLFLRDNGKYKPYHVHADMDIDGSVGVLSGKFLHFTMRSFSNYMRKFDRYTTWASLDRAKKTDKVTAMHVFFRPIGRFMKQYILKRGFLDGLPGLILCILSSFSVFMKYAKLWEMRIKDEK